MKVKTMIRIAAICFAVIPMIAFAVLSNIMVRGNGNEVFEDELKNMASAQAAAMDALLDKAHSDVDTLANMTGVSDYGSSGGTTAKTAADAAINRFIGDNPVVRAVYLTDAKGKIAAGTDKDKELPGFASYADYKDDVLYFDEVADAESSVSSMIIKKTLSKATLFISYNLGTDNSIVGRFASAASFYNQGAVAIIDPNSCWSSGNAIYNNLEKQFTTAVTEQIPGLADGSVSDIFSFEGPNGDTSGILVRAGGEDGLVALVHCPTSRADYYAAKSLTPVITVAILLAAAAVVASIFISKIVTRPLGKIEETLVKIRRGDHEARIGTMTNNEYGQMSRAFNNVVDEIVVSEDRYRVISEMSDNIIFEWNFKTNDVVFSNNFNKKFSFRPASDHFGDSFLMKAKLHPDDADRYRSDLDQLEKGKNFENNEYRIKNIYGDFIWILIRTATLNDTEGKPLKAVGVMVDIDRAKKSEAKLTEQASYDALTELYNRETIESQIDNEISLSEMRQSEMAVLFIDVDDFKHYNDNYSHATGDQVLKFLAKTIKEAVDGIGFAGRYGGDEFIAMVRNAETNDPADIAQKLIDKLAAGFDADVGERLSVSVSIGIAVIKDDYNTRVEYLIGKADDAMYSVKKSGKSNFAFI